MNKICDYPWNPWIQSVKSADGREGNKEKRDEKENRNKKIPKCEPSNVVTYSENDILEELGPAQARSPDPCPYP